MNYLFTGLVRGKIRLEHIKKYHYDYYDNHPNDFNRRMWHNFKHVLFEKTTIFLVFLITAVEVYFLGYMD